MVNLFPLVNQYFTVNFNLGESYFNSTKKIRADKKGEDEFDERKKANKDKKIRSCCKIIFRSICILIQSMIFLTLDFLTYLGLYLVLKNMTSPVQTVTVSSEGPAAEMYPDRMGQYNLLRDVYRYDRAVYKHEDRDDRFIIYTGRNRSVYL